VNKSGRRVPQMTSHFDAAKLKKKKGKTDIDVNNKRQQKRTKLLYFFFFSRNLFRELARHFLCAHAHVWNE
jgi:hypothetical protein